MGRHVVTGAPGTGKTSMLNVVARTHLVVEEPARALLSEQRGSGGARLDQRPGLFLDLLLERSLAVYEAAAPTGVTVYDRGVPDCIAYARASGVETTGVVAAARGLAYVEPILLAPPWPEIYTTDEWRRATFSQVEVFHSYLVSAYAELGLTVVEIPLGTIEERAAFVIDVIESS